MSLPRVPTMWITLSSISTNEGGSGRPLAIGHEALRCSISGSR
jgi:hypothetical protein